MSFKDIELSEGAGNYYKLVEGENRCRLISQPVNVWVAFDKETKKASKYLTREGAMKNPDVRERYALHVIDRADGKIKLAEFGPQIMKGIKLLANSLDFKFDDLPPYDICVIREGSGLDTTYTVTGARANSELTAAEQAEIKELESVYEILKVEALDKDTAPPEFLK